MKITLHSFPPSVNQAYLTMGRYRVLTPVARCWKEMVAVLLGKLTVPPEFIDKPLQLHAIFYAPDWYCKNKSIKRRDVENYAKLTVDSIFSSLEDLDDKQLWSVTLDKKDGPEEKIEVELTLYKEN